jgi:hypothetical protein
MNLGRDGRPLRMRRPIVSHEVLTPARSGIRGSRSFASKGGFPEGEKALRCYQQSPQGVEGLNMSMGRTVEEIRNPDIYADVFSEVVCNNSRVRQREAEDISEENDGL